MKLPVSLFFIILVSLLPAPVCFSQPCTGGAPSYTINLTGDDDSVWTSPSLTRAGNCCGTSNCIEFNVTLDPGSNGLMLEIISGSTPGGSLDYQISCSGSNSFGSAVCVSGVGPHRITFCKPGGNANNYRVTALPKPNITGRTSASSSCPALLKAKGFSASGLTWISVPNNTTHNSYLSCSTGCDSVSVTPTGSVSYPLNLTYRVCGNASNSCGSVSTCDTVDLRFVASHAVAISPESPAVCSGNSTTSISAAVSNGLSPFTYLWSNNAATSTVSVGTGTYIIAVTDAIGCTVARDTVMVTNASRPTPSINGNADPCTNSSYTYNTQNVSGYRYLWTASGGSVLGSDSGSDVTVLWGSSGPGYVAIRQSSAQGCDSTRLSSVTIRALPSPVISGNDSPCSTRHSVYSVSSVTSNNYLWSVNGGTINGSNITNSVDITWGQAGNGSVSLIQTNTYGCNYTRLKNISIKPVPSGCTLYHY